MNNEGEMKVLVLWINPRDGIISRVSTDLHNEDCFAQYIGVGQSSCVMECIGDGL